MVPTTETTAVSTKPKADPNRWTFRPMKLKHLPVPPYKRAADGQSLVAQVDYWDASTPGFGMRISSTGRRVWCLLGRLPRHGKEQVRRFT
jgi:hypothetical protein